MATIQEHVHADCACGKDRKFGFVLAYVDYHGIVPCAKCLHCGRVVPGFTWEYFKETGKIRIPV